MHELAFPNGAPVPRLGQGTWRMGEVRSERAREVAALRHGLDLGMTLIDTAEMYGEGGAEDVVGEAILDRRNEVYLVSKVYPHNADRRGAIDACERSLRRLRTDIIDLYLLHWQGSHPLEETVEAFERLKEMGKIRQWGVSNFDASDMATFDAPDMAGCSTDQVLYNPLQRGIEFDLLPWAGTRGMPLMAYCPLGQGGQLLANPSLQAIADRHGRDVSQVVLAWILRHKGMIAIPKAIDLAHVESNAAANTVELTHEDLKLIDAALPPPKRKMPLSIV